MDIWINSYKEVKKKRSKNRDKGRLHPDLTGETRLSRMDKVERVMKMVKRMSPRKKRREGGGGRAGGPGELESPDTLCDELCRFSLCISGEKLHLKVVCVYVCVCVHIRANFDVVEE